MSFLKKIFGQTIKVKQDISIRAQFRDYAFFEKELTRINKWLNTDTEDDKIYLQENDSFLPSHYYGRFSTDEKKIEVLYSMGKPIEEVRAVFLEALPNFIKGWHDYFQNYSQSLKVISLAILLEIPDKQFMDLVLIIEKTNNNNILKRWGPGALIAFLINSKKKEFVVPEKVFIPELYQSLFDLRKLEKTEAEKALEKYLGSWYKKNKNAAWYENHKKSWCYSGYWSWEAGAVAKILELDAKYFKNNPYLPFDLVYS